MEGEGCRWGEGEEITAGKVLQQERSNEKEPALYGSAMRTVGRLSACVIADS